jgi:hypothetical protein
MRRLLIPLLFLLLVSCALANPGPEYRVVTHPDGPLYVGDLVSFEVFAPPDGGSGEAVEVSYEGQVLGSASFVPYGIGQRDQATFWWVWDTSGLEPGRQTLTFSLAGGYSWEETIRLRPAERVPAPEPDAQWEMVTTDCCRIHYISGTDAARDIAQLAEIADRQSQAVAAQMGASLPERIDVTFMPRVIGHGGFAWDGLYISYLDENYAGNEMDIVLHHEFVHYYDGSIGGECLPSIFQEGLATYLSGGHFKPEPIGPRAAALLDLDWYIPLEPLANDFYNHQHETGYLEAAALVQYFHETYGPGAFNEFYRTIECEGQTPAQAIDAALRDNFSLSLPDLETAFISYLSAQPVTDDIRTDLELTVSYFDTLRRYQSVFDPSAYFLTAWLPDGRVMRERGIVADLTRRPLRWQNRLVEALLVRAHAELFGGDYESARQTLEWTNRILGWISP